MRSLFERASPDSASVRGRVHTARTFTAPLRRSTPVLAVCAVSSDDRSPSQRGGVGRTETSGPTAYPAAKAKRDRSMPLKRGRSEDVYGRVSRDPRAMVTAKLPEPQPPAMQAHVPCRQRLLQGCLARVSKRPIREPSTGRAGWNDHSHGGGRGTYGALGRLSSRECRMAYGGRPLWSRNARRTRGSNDPPGRSGKPATGGRGIGVCGERAGR